MGHDILDITVQNVAKPINSVQTYNLVMHELMNQSFGEVVFMRQPVFSYALFFHGHP